MERRREKRWPRQLDAKFGVPNEKPHHAVATNISVGGIFLRTPLVSPPGTRFRVEVIHSSQGFIAEAVVVRAQKTPAHLQSIRPSGMGLRFLQPAELVQAMLPSMVATTKREEPKSPVGQGASSAAAAEGTATPERRGPQDLQVGTPVAAPAPTAEEFRPPPVESLDLERPIFSVTYRDLDQIKQVFERDIKTGGIFVPTPEPEPLDRVVQVEVGIVGERPVRVDARVVHSVQPEPGGGENMLVGMGVQFTDPTRAIFLFEKLIYG